MEVFLVFVLIGLGLAFIPAKIAENKGREFFPWYFYGFFLFLIALIHSFLLKPYPGSPTAMKLAGTWAGDEGVSPVKTLSIDFTADGVISGTPYRTEPDGVVALISGKAIKFKSLEDLELMLSVSTGQGPRQ
ncbi:hypothetical protein ABLE91_05825 [Aquabacter sp. CN5-332]|uniref:hypothetical protein n=1 Tax=Aquabacter sp. CN5-332 TaxID=3156608 RepID=UPI0032B5539F